MRKVLLAPGEADDQNERNKWSFFTAPIPVHYVGRVFPGGALYFPHIDSCLAIVFKLKSGSVVGGHAGIMYVYGGTMEDYGGPSLKKVLKDMKNLCGGQEIDELFAIGNTQDWGCNVKETIRQQCPSANEITTKDMDKPINVVVDVGTQEVKVKAYNWIQGQNNNQWMYSKENPEYTKAL